MSSGRLFQYFWVGATEIVIPMSYFFGCEVSHTNMYTHRAEGSSIAEILIVLQQNKYYGTRTACFKIDSITPELNGIENKTAIIYLPVAGVSRDPAACPFSLVWAPGTVNVCRHRSPSHKTSHQAFDLENHS